MTKAKCLLCTSSCSLLSDFEQKILKQFFIEFVRETHRRRSQFLKRRNAHLVSANDDSIPILTVLKRKARRTKKIKKADFYGEERKLFYLLPASIKADVRVGKVNLIIFFWHRQRAKIVYDSPVPLLPCFLQIKTCVFFLNFSHSNDCHSAASQTKLNTERNLLVKLRFSDPGSSGSFVSDQTHLSPNNSSMRER